MPSKASYISYHICPKCHGLNDYSIKGYEGDGHISEAQTKCIACGHKNYWAFGHYSSTEPAFDPYECPQCKAPTGLINKTVKNKILESAKVACSSCNFAGYWSASHGFHSTTKKSYTRTLEPGKSVSKILIIRDVSRQLLEI